MEIPLSDIGDFYPGGILTDEQKSALDGSRAKIAKVSTVTEKSKFGLDGKELPLGQTIDVLKVRVETTPIAKDPNGNDVTIRQSFSLKFESGKWKVSHHEKSHSAQFFAKYGINRFEDALGKEVILVKKVNPVTKKVYLEISI